MRQIFKSFSRKDNLERHKRSVHSHVQYSCDKCERTFNRKDKYLDHYNNCTTRCEYCETNLDNHIRTHHGDKRYMCTKCGKKYSEKRDLKNDQEKCSQMVSTINVFIR